MRGVNVKNTASRISLGVVWELWRKGFVASAGITVRVRHLSCRLRLVCPLTISYLLAFTGPCCYLNHNLPRRLLSWPVSCTLSPLLQPVHSGRHISKDVFSHIMWRISTILSMCHDEIDDGLLCDMIIAIVYPVSMPLVFHTQESAYPLSLSFLVCRCTSAATHQPHPNRLIIKLPTSFTRFELKAFDEVR